MHLSFLNDGRRVAKGTHCAYREHEPIEEVEFVTNGDADEDAADENGGGEKKKGQEGTMWGSTGFFLIFKAFGRVPNRIFDVLRGVCVGLTL